MIKITKLERYLAELADERPRISLRAALVVLTLARGADRRSPAEIAEIVAGDREHTGVHGILHWMAERGDVEIVEPERRIGSDAPRRVVHTRALRDRLG